jgi:hypothetical protein
VLLEASRHPDPSFHVWILFSLPVPAKIARWLGLRCLEIAGLNPKAIEVFPKQSELTKGTPFGNFVKLPLGLHQVERKWSRLLNPETFEPLPNEVLPDCWGISFSEEDIAKITSFQEKNHVQATFESPKHYKPLTSNEEERAVQFLCKYWRKGFRNQLEMAFLGWCLKRVVAYESARRIIIEVARRTNDEEKAARLQLVNYHYRNRVRFRQKLKGTSGLREVIEGVFEKND